MWDYNIGLVRTTHLFKCLGYPKVFAVDYRMDESPNIMILDYSR